MVVACRELSNSQHLLAHQQQQVPPLLLQPQLKVQYSISLYTCIQLISVRRFGCNCCGCVFCAKSENCTAHRTAATRQPHSCSRFIACCCFLLLLLLLLRLVKHENVLIHNYKYEKKKHRVFRGVGSVRCGGRCARCDGDLRATAQAIRAAVRSDLATSSHCAQRSISAHARSCQDVTKQTIYFFALF